MTKVKRFGVSLESELLRRFDAQTVRQGYRNRSEAIRDLIRENLVAREWEDPDRETVGILGLVYEHEKRELTETLTRLQHRHHGNVISSTHIHLDGHNCLEVIIFRGKSRLIRKIADGLLSTKSVKHGELIMTTTGVDLP